MVRIMMIVLTTPDLESRWKAMHPDSDISPDPSTWTTTLETRTQAREVEMIPYDLILTYDDWSYRQYERCGEREREREREGKSMDAESVVLTRCDQVISWRRSCPRSSMMGYHPASTPPVILVGPILFSSFPAQDQRSRW